MPDEPSVLDYLKSKLKFWEGREKIEIPNEPDLLQGAPRVASRERTVEPAGLPNEPVPSVEPPRKSPVQASRWPWRSLLAMAIALLAQRSWEPSPDQTALIGLILYALSLALLIWAYFTHEWSLAPVPETGSASDTLQVRRLPLILGILLTLAAFITLGHNLFTFWNVTLWILAIACLIWSFWLPGKNAAPPWRRAKSFFARPAWQFKITRWTLLVLAVAAVVAFFRIYNLSGVPSEPNSDHAEKILDIFDITQGQPRIFFPRNTGREGIQMYLTLLVSWVFGKGLSFPSLKIGTVICGLATLPFLYLLGREYGGKRIGLLAVFFAGIAYWPNVISRFGLRFPLYPLFVAPTLYFLIRGLRTRDRNQLILSGLFLGFGLHGYTPFRIVPLVVVAAVGLYLLHSQSRGNRKQAIAGLVILAAISFIVFLPLARFWLENPADFAYRAFTRLGPSERPLPGPAFQIFLTNIWNAVRMFNWKDGETWAHSVVFRPALDVVSGALFLIGVVLVLVRYFRERHWQDLFLLLAVPLLQLPSILSLAFPNENPDLARAGASFVPAFLFVALALDGLLAGIQAGMSRRVGTALAWVVVLFLAAWSSFQNYDLAFRQYADRYTASTWNSSEMGTVIKQFRQVHGTTDSVWIVAYPHWVDTRLPGIWAGIPNRDFAIWPQDFEKTLEVKGNKLFMVKADDPQDLDLLRQLYPQGVLSTFRSATNLEGKDFLILFVPSNE
jgi:hypothetical protein